MSSQGLAGNSARSSTSLGFTYSAFMKLLGRWRGGRKGGSEGGGGGGSVRKNEKKKRDGGRWGLGERE